MELDKETLENMLKNLSKAKFDGICRVILTEYFHLDPINVDRRGDGGGDWITIPYGVGKRAFVAQATVQDSSWKSKCMKDAEKAVNNFNCRKYLFLTSRRRDSVDLLDIENQIQDKFDIPASCLGAVEIADILLARKLVHKAFQEAGMDTGESEERPDHKEQLLFGALSLSSHAAALRNEVHEDAIIYALSSHGSMQREDLIKTVIETLQCGHHREGRVNSRIDSLLTRGAIRKIPETHHLDLSLETLESLQLAKAIYQEQFLDLTEKLNAIIGSFDFSITDEKVLANISTYASRAMIAGTIKAAKNAGVSIQNALLLEQLGEPKEALMAILKQTIGRVKELDQIIEGVLTVTQAHPLVFRLSQELLHFAIDGINPVHHVKALGVSSWAETETILDASVAIPFLCSQLTQPSAGRFSRGALAGVFALQKVGSSMCISQDYLQEAAVHLLHAVDYCRPFADPAILVASPNGYVSHYYTLRQEGVSVPARLIDFLLLLAPSLRNVSSQNIVSQIANDLAGKYSDFGITKINFGQIHHSFITNINDSYSRHLSSAKPPRDSILIKHDTRTLAWMKKCRTEGNLGKLCLTWDELMISVNRDDESSGWAVTPHQVSDLISVGSKRDEGALLSVVHELAATRTAHEDLVGKLLDHVIKYAREGLLEWEVVSELSQLRHELHDRAINEGSPDPTELKSIEEDFWKRHGINVNAPHERTSITQKDIEQALEQAH
jgi:hypothetical protein